MFGQTLFRMLIYGCLDVLVMRIAWLLKLNVAEEVYYPKFGSFIVQLSLEGTLQLHAQP